jgi:hypothetical protein
MLYDRLSSFPVRVRRGEKKASAVIRQRKELLGGKLQRTSRFREVV